MSRPNIHSVLGAIQVLHNAVGVGVSAFLEKSITKCVRLNAISVTRGWVVGVSCGSVPDFYDIYRYLNWFRVSRYHEISISNIHKYRDASSVRYIEYRAMYIKTNLVSMGYMFQLRGNQII